MAFDESNITITQSEFADEKAVIGNFILISFILLTVSKLDVCGCLEAIPLAKLAEEGSTTFGEDFNRIG